MKYDAKAVVIGRKKKTSEDQEGRPCFVSLFDVNDPHRTGEAPKEIVDFDDVIRVEIRGLDANYVLAGNDIVINNLVSLDVDQVDGRLIVKGQQND